MRNWNAVKPEGMSKGMVGFQPTYEELKQESMGHKVSAAAPVFSLPMRNWNIKQQKRLEDVNN